MIYDISTMIDSHNKYKRQVKRTKTKIKYFRKKIDDLDNYLKELDKSYFIPIIGIKSYIEKNFDNYKVTYYVSTDDLVIDIHIIGTYKTRYKDYKTIYRFEYWEDGIQLSYKNDITNKNQKRKMSLDIAMRKFNNFIIHLNTFDKQMKKRLKIRK